MAFGASSTNTSSSPFPSSSSASISPSPTRLASVTSSPFYNLPPARPSPPQNNGQSILTPATTSTSHHSSAASSPLSTLSSPQTVASIPAPSTKSPDSRISYSQSQRLPPIRPTAEYFSYIPPSYHYPNLDKMSMASVVSPQPPEMPKITGSMTTKEWVIPPRPKPGRKPATDTPPTKRKAQNRAAQRAFRERRAARVGELEELLDQEKLDYDKKETEHKDRIHQLEMDLQSSKSRSDVLENLLQQERKDRVKAENELESCRRRWGSDDRRSSHGSETRLPSAGQQLPSINGAAQMDSTENFTCGSCDPNGRCACAESIIKSVESGCGKCGPGATCECLDETIKSTSMPDLKRAPSPSLASAEKRQRQRSSSNGPEMTYETDFTSYFKRPPPNPQQSAMSSDLVKDPCGFCKVGDYCVCADTQMSGTTAAPTQQTHTPPPSEDDVVPPMPMEISPDGAVKLRPRPQATVVTAPVPASRSGCGPSGPGTCAQCIADPISGLFCRALSANLKGKGGGGCCGGKDRDGGCCKSGGGSGSGSGAASASASAVSAPAVSAAPTKGAGFGLSLSCAEAYQTLSSHRNFDKATDDIASWLPKLRAAPRPPTAAGTLPLPNVSSRLPIEVEAASIMSVLKDFDIRFGRGL